MPRFGESSVVFVRGEMPEGDWDIHTYNVPPVRLLAALYAAIVDVYPVDVPRQVRRLPEPYAKSLFSHGGSLELVPLENCPIPAIPLKVELDKLQAGIFDPTGFAGLFHNPNDGRDYAWDIFYKISDWANKPENRETAAREFADAFQVTQTKILNRQRANLDAIERRQRELAENTAILPPRVANRDDGHGG